MNTKKFDLIRWRKIMGAFKIAAKQNPPLSDISLLQISAAPPQEGMKSYLVADTIKATYLLFFSTILFFSSCQKVIDVAIKNTEKKYVVEANVTDKPGDSKVLLSATKNVSDNNNFPGINGATVSITDNAGNSTLFTETSEGSYTAPNFTGEPGKTYSLLLKLNGETFTAQSTMPQKINLDTLFVSDELLFGETRKLVNIAYQDPAGKGQSYRFVQYINGIKNKTIFANNDDYTDGKKVESKLWYIADDDNEDEKIMSGDTILLDMQCIDAAVYKYWFSLHQSATGNSQSASPANAVTNINGGALGYFSAHTLQTKSVIVP